LAERGAFRFAATHSPSAHPWNLLDLDLGDDVVPAIGDAASVTWTMHKALGDDLEYRDERGQSFHVRIVATLADSILQGSLLIAQRHFVKRFPSTSGFREFLIDAPRERSDQIAARLSTALADIGLEVVPAGDRLQAFHVVQNTYLLIFQALGGLGLLLGSAGLGIVVLRNVLERRGELALLRAVGFRQRDLQRLVVREHGLLLVWGVGCGVVAALVAILPGLLSAGGIVSAGPMALLVAGLATMGLLWVALAGRVATRGELLSALREA
jgi:ABC-type antimicrobial peptide transport system permease subunit